VSHRDCMWAHVHFSEAQRGGQNSKYFRYMRGESVEMYLAAMQVQICKQLVHSSVFLLSTLVSPQLN
jgi:hypothetical protein